MILFHVRENLGLTVEQMPSAQEDGVLSLIQSVGSGGAAVQRLTIILFLYDMRMRVFSYVNLCDVQRSALGIIPQEPTPLLFFFSWKPGAFCAGWVGWPANDEDPSFSTTQCCYQACCQHALALKSLSLFPMGAGDLIQVLVFVQQVFY